MGKTAAEILGNADYKAMCYGGYRQPTREIQPTVAEIKEDMLILHATGVRIVRDYNVQFDHARTLLVAIRELMEEDPSFEMYVMLGAWIDCLHAWTDREPDHDAESTQANAAEIQRAVDLANEFPDIVKIIAVGNEAMVHWAASYYVQPSVILKWVNHLQDMKRSGDLPAGLWITTSDDFSSWGGGDPVYHTPDLEALYRAVDYVSMHTYPMHNTHYNPAFWLVPEDEQELSEKEKIDRALLRARDFAVGQYEAVVDYMRSLGVDKPVHIGETGWATFCDDAYGTSGSGAADEYKSGEYFRLMRAWSDEHNVSCFYFEAFDEPWKDQNSPGGSENHFGLINLNGEAKYGLWDFVEQGKMRGLTRGGRPIIRSYEGKEEALLAHVIAPPVHY